MTLPRSAPKTCAQMPLNRKKVALLRIFYEKTFVRHLCCNNNLINRYSESVTAQLSKDIDGSGVVDIVDAYLIAKRLQQDRTVTDKWDFSNDGIVNEKAVREVAQTAVTIKGRDA